MAKHQTNRSRDWAAALMASCAIFCVGVQAAAQDDARDDGPQTAALVDETAAEASAATLTDDPDADNDPLLKPAAQTEGAELISDEAPGDQMDGEPRDGDLDDPGETAASDAPDSGDIADALQEGVGPVDDEGALAAEDEATARDWGRLQPAADLVEAGGPIIVILALLSIVSLAIIVVKLLQFAAARAGDHRFIEKAGSMIEKGRTDDALDFVARRRGVVARVMETALRGKSLGAADAQVREEVQRIAQIKLDGLERGLPLLSLIATISPLLGLLGTVLGMIEAFQQLENAGDRVDPAILSGGIWEALLTTAAGLSVAIPAAAFFTWLQRTVDVAGQHMENAATRVFTADLYATGRRAPKESDD